MEYFFVQYKICGSREIVHKNRLLKIPPEIGKLKAVKVFWSPSSSEHWEDDIKRLKKDNNGKIPMITDKRKTSAGYYSAFILKWAENDKELENEIDEGRRIKVPPTKYLQNIISSDSETSLTSKEKISKKKDKNKMENEKKRKSEEMNLALMDRRKSTRNKKLKSLFLSTQEEDNDIEENDFSTDDEDVLAVPAYELKEKDDKIKELSKQISAINKQNIRTNSIPHSAGSSSNSLESSDSDSNDENDENEKEKQKKQCKKTSNSLSSESLKAGKETPHSPESDHGGEGEEDSGILHDKSFESQNSSNATEVALLEKKIQELQTEIERRNSIVTYLEKDVMKVISHSQNKDTNPYPEWKFLFRRPIKKEKLNDENKIVLYRAENKTVAVGPRVWFARCGNDQGDSMFTKGLMEFFWTDEELAERTATGAPCNTKKGDDDYVFTGKALTPEKKKIIKSICASRMYSQNPEIDDKEFGTRIKNLNLYFREKIQGVKRIFEKKGLMGKYRDKDGTEDKENQNN